MELPFRIGEKTLVPLSFALVVIGGGACWMTKISFELDAHASLITEGKRVRDLQYTDVINRLERIEQHIAGIEGEMKGKNP